MNTRVLTGITTSGTPHLGNYAGAIRPSILASREPQVDAFYFMADYHALIKCDDPQRVSRSRLEIAATWLAAGLDPDLVTFYRQSDIPEIPELCWILTCVTAKGMMNRAHAYKAAVDANEAKQIEPDDGVTMGLFSYPVLMAADILMFGANKVPVGRDQVQHLEMARDIAQRFNHLYGQGHDLFVLPDVLIDDKVATLPGLDGRKMSKSYDNTIPLFEGGSAALKAAISRIVTDSRKPGEPKDTEGSHLFDIYRAFATPEQTQAFQASLQDGLGWGDAKQALYKLVEEELAPMRDHYNELMNTPDQIEDILQAGAKKARSLAQPLMGRVRAAVGLRMPGDLVNVSARCDVRSTKPVSRFVSFRDTDGVFRFRLLDHADQQVFLSEPFLDPKQAGYVMRSLQHGLVDDWLVNEGDTIAIILDGIVACRFPSSQLEAVRTCLPVKHG